VLDTAGKFAKDKYLYAEDTDDKSTDITLVAPRPGLWGIVTLAGSSPVVSVSAAIVEPEASAAGSVTGTGATRTLHYLFEHEPNQQIEFFERGTGYEHPIGLASGAACSPSPTIPPTPAGSMPEHPTFTCGVIAFRPAPGPAGRRNIVGVVENQGEATREIHVASYIALAQPRLPAPVRLAILRSGTAVTLRWSAVAGASTYDVSVALNDGERLVQIVPGDKTSVTVAEPVAPSDKVTATVTAVSAEEIAGGTTTAIMGRPGAVPLGPEPPTLS
jgi:hypothetical protein